jgi:hypothetical protein
MIRVEPPLALLMSLAALALAAPAQADQYDFISDLDNNGVYYSDVTDVIDLGKQLCKVGRSAPTSEALLAGMGTMLRRSGFTSPAEIEIVVSSAANNMCPDIWPQVRAAAQQGQGEGAA